MAANILSLTAQEAAGTHENIIPDSILARHCPLNDGHQATNVDFRLAPTLSDLEALPVELQQLMVKELDVRSLLAFCRVNKRAMDLVASLIEWQKVRHAISPRRRYY
jgi:hypothetical protein